MRDALTALQCDVLRQEADDVNVWRHEIAAKLACRAMTEVFFPDGVELYAVSPDEFRRSVRRCAIDNDDFRKFLFLLDETSEQLFQLTARIVGRYDDA